MNLPYLTGCPIWANKAWSGALFRRNAGTADYLRQYSSALNAVEGNCTFYGLPGEETVRRWQEDSARHFRFSFKFPRQISHDLQLQGCQKPLKEFFQRLEPLGEKLGTFFLQLPPQFQQRNLADLALFLQALPRQFRYAVEVRHADFFDGGRKEWEFDTLLHGQSVNRACFNTSVLQAVSSQERSIIEAQRKKPKFPDRYTLTAPEPFIRYVGYNDVENNIPHMQPLVVKVAEWLQQGYRPAVFMHSPDDLKAPQLCRLFHQMLSEKIVLPPLPPWPGEEEPQQLELF